MIWYLYVKKGVQPEQSSITEEETEEEIEREEVETTVGTTKGEAGPSRVKRCKIDALI